MNLLILKSLEGHVLACLENMGAVMLENLLKVVDSGFTQIIARVDEPDTQLECFD